MKSKVFACDMRASIKENMFQKLRRLIRHLEMGQTVEKADLVAIKLHFGEKGNTSFIRPVYIRQVVESVLELEASPFVTDANTLYVGSRSNSVDHLKTAIENGFDYSVVGAPLIIADGLKGTSCVEVPVNLGIDKKCLYWGGRGRGECPDQRGSFQTSRTDRLRRRHQKRGHGFGLQKRQTGPTFECGAQGQGQEVHRLRRLRGVLRPVGHFPVG